MPIRTTQRSISARTQAGVSETTYTVGSLTKAIRGVLESSFQEIVVEGEISNFVDHRSGHKYWTLKDAEAQISCVFWKTRLTNAKLKDGMKVLCRGRLSVYPARGNYQFDVHQVRPVGIGELQKAYEVLFAKLEQEGLFAMARKRVLPKFPKSIGIVTSETGAALQDMLTVLRRRYPLVNVILRPATVQGIGAELHVARAIQEFNLLDPSNRPDLLIVGRGGGSLEDLWCFNEEAVARAIFASQIPIVSAVGHEVDFTIADYVADLRAPTPSAAAELSTPDLMEIYSALLGFRRGMTRFVTHELEVVRRELEIISDPAMLRASLSEKIAEHRRELVRHGQRTQRSLRHQLEGFHLRLERDHAKLAVMNPYRVLERGYAILESPEGKVIPRLESLLGSGEQYGILVFVDGKVTVRFD